MSTRSDVSIFYAYFHDFLDAMDLWRGKFNRHTGHLEAWQIVSYTFSAILFVSWLRKILSSEHTILDRFVRSTHSTVRSFPWVHSKFSEIIAVARNHFEEEIHKEDFLREFYKFLPERGLDPKDIQREAREYSTLGRPIIPVSAQPDQPLNIAQEISTMFLRDGSPKGIRKMEAEIVKMISTLLHAGHGSIGSVTTGNMESVILVFYAARRRALSLGIENPEVLVPISADPLFDHIGEMLRIPVIKIPVDKEDRVDVLRLRRRISSSTAFIVVSAPNHTTGTMDDISRVSEITTSYSIPLHVDASLGGFLLPFLDLTDISYPPVDFRLSGVTSMALDLNGYGQCPRRGSVLIFRDESWLRYHTFIDTRNRIGIYVSPTVNKSRDPALIASIWSTLLFTGRDGYVDATSMIVETTRKLVELLKAMKDVQILGSPDLCLVAFTTTMVDVYALGEKMIDEGWPLEIGPKCLRIRVTLDLYEKDRLQTLLADLEDAISALLIDTTYASESKMAAMHRMIESSMDSWLVGEILRAKLLAEHSMPAPIERTRLRSIASDGRKMSTITEKSF